MEDVEERIPRVTLCNLTPFEQHAIEILEKIIG
jgi:hypothetical protein